MICSINASAGNILCQRNSLWRGFAELGHNPSADKNDSLSAFCFVGNPPYTDYLNLAKSKSTKTIFGVLDLAQHCREWPEIEKSFIEQLPLADRVTCISKTVQKQLKEICGIDSEVTYYPIKPVKYTGIKKYPQYKVALVGRVGDKNKRAESAVKALIMAGYEEKEVAIVGPEYFGYGVNCGVISNEILNDIYNSVDFVLMLSKNEGIGLVACEAACCGAIPIVLPDLSTFDEFWLDSPLGINYRALTSVEQVAKLIMDLNNNPKWKADVKESILGYAELAFRPLFEPKAVAQRIIDIANSI